MQAVKPRTSSANCTAFPCWFDQEIITGDSGDEKLLFVVVQIKDTPRPRGCIHKRGAIGGKRRRPCQCLHEGGNQSQTARHTFHLWFGYFGRMRIGHNTANENLAASAGTTSLWLCQHQPWPRPSIQAAAPPVVVAPAPTPFANTTPPPKEHCTTAFPPSMLPPPVAVIPPAPPKAAPAATSVPPVPQSTPPVVAAPVAPPQPPAVPILGTVVPKPATAPAPAPMPAPPVTAPIVPGGEAPATPEEYQNFVGKRAAKLVRDKLTPAGLKQAGDLMKAYLLKQSGKVQLKQISAATFEAVLAALESATPEQAVSIVQEGAK
jgi:hypothetical protein